MNKHCCRIVFNKPQGLPMAVTETATRPSQASGTASVLPGGRQPLFMAALKPLTFLFWGLLGMVLIPVAEAQIVADPSAPGNRRPTVLEAPNGVPLVNIQTPSAAGVSRNNYQQFDVNPQGAILNNSRQNIQTQLGGWVHGNPWLSKGEARIILNEVNSSNPSLLQGYMEIAGQRAQIVIANPAGVTCDGCGFINANRATVTTGTPLVTDGNLEAYRVQGGTVIVTGKGMDASGADYTDLIARSAEINAGLWARQLQVTAGVNDVSADAARITAKTGSGSAPVFAVDVSSLGGMYADKIVLVGSEAGVGVRNAGVIAAAAGEIAVTADGRLINQGAMISGDQALTIAARGVDNSGVLSTERNLTLTSQGGVDNSGLLHAGQELILDAGGTLSNRQGTLDAGRLDIEAQSLDNQDGTIRQSGAQALSLTAARIANTAGALIGGLTPSRAEAPSNSGIPAGDSDLDGYLPDSAASGAFDALPAASATPVPLADDRIVARDQLTNSGQIIASGKFTVSAAQNLANAGELTLDRLAVSGEALRNNGLISAAGVSVDAVTLDNSGGRLETAQLELGVHARDLLNIQGDIRHTGSAALGLALAGRLDNRDGQIASNGALALDASAVDNRAGKIESQGAVTFTSGEIDNTAGRISAAQALQFTADSLDNQDGQITGMGSGTFNLNGQLDNRGGLLATDGELSLDVGSLDNRQGGQILANDLLTVNTLTGALNNAGGLVSSQQALTVTARDELANAGGQIVAGTALRLTTGGDVDNTRGTLGALAGALELDAGGSLDNSGGRIEAATDLTLASRGFVNAQGVAFGQTLLIDARQQSVDNTDGILAAEKTLTIASGALDNTRGLFLSRGGLTLDTLADFNNAGQLTAAGNLSLATAGALTNDGLLQAGDTLSIRSPSLTNNVTGEMQGGALDIAVSGALVNRGLIDGGEARIDAGTLDNLGTGRIYGDHLALAADTLNNLPENTDAPVIAARERLDLGVGTLNNRDGALIFSAGDLAIGGGIDGNGHAVGQTASIDNASATIEALGDLTIDAAHLLNRKTAFATDRIQSDEAPSGMALLDYAPGLEFRWPIKETSPTTWRGYVRDRYLNVIARLLGGGPDEDMNDFIDIWSDLADSAVPAGDGLDAAVRARLVEAVNAMPMNEAAYSQAIWHTLIDTLGAVSPEMLQALVNSLSETGVSPQTYNQFCADWDDDCSYVENSVTTYATARDIVTVDTPAAVIRAGGGAAIAATTLENHYSTIQSGGDMALTGATLTNVGAELYLLTDTSTTTQLWHWVSRGKGATTAAASTQTLIGSAPALISAGGTLSGSFTGRIDNLTIRQNTAPVVGPIGTAPIGAAAVSVTPGARLVQVIAADNADGPAALIVTAELALTLPANRLYHTQPGSASAYLIETDPVFASYRKWLGSDYLLDALGADPATVQKRLGDGFYEQRLIAEQIAQLTGRRFLDGYASDEEQYQALMNTGITCASEWNLIPGIALSAEQMARLTSDIVWLVEREIVLADGGTQKVLVPQVYVRVQDGDLSAQGALIAANDLWLDTTGELVTSGTIAGREIVALSAENIQNLRGRVTGQNLLVQANNDLTLRGGTLEAERTLIAAAGRDLTVESSTVDRAYRPPEGQAVNAAVQTRVIDRVAGLYVSGENGTLIAAAGNDLTLIAAAVINAAPTVTTGNTGATLLSAGHDLTLGTVTETSAASTSSKNNRWQQSTSAEIGSTIFTDGDLTLTADNDLSARAANVIASGALAASAGNDLLVTTGEATFASETWHKSTKSGLLSSQSKESLDTLDRTTALASAFSGDSVTLSAGNDLTITGSDVNAQHDLIAIAGRDLILDTATETYNETHYRKEKSSGITSSLGSLSYGTSSLQQNADGQGETHVSSSLSGENVLLSSGRDTQISAATIIADQDLTVLAGRNIELLAVADHQEQETHSKSRSGGASFNADLFGQLTIYGQTSASEETDGQLVRQNTALLSANAGDLTLYAGLDSQYNGAGQGNILAQGADLLAGSAITLSGNAVTLLAVANEASSHSLTKSKSFIIGARPAGLLGSAINTIGDSIKRADDTDNDRLQGALALKAGYDAWKLYDGGIDKLQALSADNLAGADGNGNPGGALIGVQVYTGSSKSKAESDTHETHVTGTNLQAQTIAIEARETDLTLEAAKLQAENITLTARRDLLVTAAANTASIHSDSKSSSVGAGVTFGLGQQTGFSIQLNAGQAQGQANGTETAWDNTLITASDTLTLRSGSDTILRGAQLAGNSVFMDIGGNLLIETLQDQSQYESKQSSSGFSVSLCIPPICYGSLVQSASIYDDQHQIKHNYLSAVGQSGIVAGDGGFDITVGGNTELIGAAITSTAEQDKNRLTTASLTSRDLENVQTTKASGSSISLSYGGGGAMATLAANAKSNLLANLDYNAALPENQDEKSTTQSVISPANITITGTGNEEIDRQSEETVALLTSRDPETANQSLTNTLTLQQAQLLEEKIQKQRENQEAARIAGAVVSDYAESKTRDYLDAWNKKLALEREISQIPPKDLESAAGQARLDELNGQVAAQGAIMEEHQADYDMWHDGAPGRMAANLLVAAIGGGDSSSVNASLIHEALTASAYQFHVDTIADSQKSPGICDSTGKCLNNQSGESIGAFGILFNTVGGRLDISAICGDDNSRCQTNELDDSLKTDILGRVQLSDGLTLKDVIAENVTISPLGGLQGSVPNSFLGWDYSPGSLVDWLTSGFGGTHDRFNKPIWYDQQGNLDKDMIGLKGNLGEAANYFNVLLTVPFAAANLIPPDLWNALNPLLKR